MGEVGTAVTVSTIKQDILSIRLWLERTGKKQKWTRKANLFNGLFPPILPSSQN